MITIHKLKHNPRKVKNTFCGPAVLAMLTGLSPEDAAIHIRTHQHLRECGRGEKRNGQSRVVKGTYFSDLKLVLDEFKFETRTLLYQPWRNSARPTLVKWFNEIRSIGDHPLLASDHAHLLSAGYHWMLEHKGMLYDSFHPKGTSLKDSKYRRRKVSEVYSIFCGGADYETVRRSLTKR
tara:strand:- start:16525 stop:17061 length:537 start_codon:yes stop_codon:yes gene_type:complete